MYFSSKNKKIAIVLTSSVLVLSVGVLMASLIITNKLQHRVAERQLQMSLDKIDLETETEYTNLYLSLNIVKDWAKNSSLSGMGVDKLNDKFIPLISNTPQVSALSVVISTGETYCIRHESPNFESYFSLNDSSEKADVNILHIDKENELYSDTTIPFKVTSLPSFYDQKMHEYDTIVRYPLQLIPGTTRLTGTAFTIKTKDDDGNEYTITAYKTLYRLYEFLNSVKLSESSEVHLFTPDGRYFDFNKIDLDKNASTLDGYLVPWDNIADTGFYTAISKWNENSSNDSISFVDYKYEGVDYIALFKPNRDAVNGIWTALVMSEADFAIILKGRIGFIFVLSIVFLVISMVVVIILLRNDGRADMFDKLDDHGLEELIKNGENDLVEFKSTVRLNLHSNKMGKEIELAWLKSVVAFCNTEGGRILIGVKDNGEVLGLESDRFPNDDKTLLHIQNLIKQHIGLEFAKYIHYALREIDGKKILVIRCQPVSVPLFLRFNDKEQFFVRSGPASIELPVSKALQYIKERSS